MPGRLCLRASGVSCLRRRQNPAVAIRIRPKSNTSIKLEMAWDETVDRDPETCVCSL
jgi:hypothetical protein